jgi:hypothetical protein
MASVRKFFWIITAIAGALAGLLFIGFVGTANGAPQEAAGAAIAIGTAIIPYVFARALDEISASKGDIRL